MTWKLYALVSAGAFAATYLVSTPGSLTHGRPAPHPVAARAKEAPKEIDMQQLADHLASRLHDDGAYHAPTRNPFAFGEAPHAAPRQVIAPKVQEPPPFVPPPPPPPMTLSGIASDRVNGEIKRTAIFSSSTGVQLAGVGESVSGNYRVVSIDENAVTLSNVTDGATLRLTLSRP